MNWGYLAIAYAGLFCLGMISNLKGAVYPDILTHFNISTAVGSGIFAYESFLGFIASFSSRWWLPRIGPVGSYRILMLILIIGTFGTGYSGSLYFGYPLLMISSMIFGFGMGGLGIDFNLLIGKGTLPSKRRKVYSGLHAMYGIASFFAPFIVGIAGRYGVDWRLLFKLFALFPLLLFFSSFAVKQKIDKISNTVKLICNIKMSTKLLMGGVFGFYVAAEMSVATRLVLFVRTVWGWDREKSVLYLGIFFLLIFIGRAIFAIFSFPLSSYKWLLISSFLSCCLYLFGLYVHPIGMVLTGLSMSFFFPCGMDWLNESFSKDFDYMTIFVMTCVSLILIITHWGIGVSASFLGIQNALLIGPVFLLFVMILLLFNPFREHLFEKNDADAL